MMPKFRAWDKVKRSIILVSEIVYSSDLSYINRVTLDGSDHKMLYGSENRQEDDVVLMQSTGLHDKNGVEIFEGDIIQQVHAYDYDKLEIETDYLEPFEVKKGNYAQGKWIAEEIDGENYSVVRYVFGKDMKVIGNVHENPELIEVEE